MILKHKIHTFINVLLKLTKNMVDDTRHFHIVLRAQYEFHSKLFFFLTQ